MHAIHTTPGFVIDSRPYSEAGKILSIFTRDLGLVSAIATGIRLEKSKLRYYVQNYSFATYSLVRGKEFWRLTSASEESSSSATVLIAKVAAILKRLLQGEEPHAELFDLIQGFSVFLHAHKDLSEDQLKSLESLTVLRILHSLGYIGKEPQFAEYVAPSKSSELTVDLIDKAITIRTLINKHINNALKESHL